MSAFADAAGGRTRRLPGFPCSIGRFMEELTEAQRAEFRDALRNGKLNIPEIQFEVFQRYDTVLSAQQLRRHRANLLGRLEGCSCPQRGLG